MKSPEINKPNMAEKPETKEALDFSFSNSWQKFKELFKSKRQSGDELLAVLEKSQGNPEQDILISEGKEMSDFCDSTISQVEDEAKQELASLLGDSGQTIEQIPQSQLKRFVWYNLSATPDGFMNESERVKNEQLLDFGYIEQAKQDWQNFLSEKIAENKVVCLGEAHTAEMIEKNAVLEFLEQAKKSGISDIGLEIDESLQEYFDCYAETGKFQESDSPDDYERVGEYQELRQEWHRTGDIEKLKAMSAFEETVKDNFIFSGCCYENYPILKKARALGIRVHCIDASQKYSREEVDQALDDEAFTEWEQKKEADRDQRMFDNIHEVVAGGKGKMLVLLGAAHLAKGEMQHKNLGDLLSADKTLKSFRVNMDRDFDSDVMIKEVKRNLSGDINLNSVFYNALQQKGIDKVGFDLNSSVLVDGEKQEREFPFDGYIKI